MAKASIDDVFMLNYMSLITILINLNYFLRVHTDRKNFALNAKKSKTVSIIVRIVSKRFYCLHEPLILIFMYVLWCLTLILHMI